MESGSSQCLGRSIELVESGSVGDYTQYKCECGLNAIIRTSFTFQNMGKRFRCCPKKEDQCKYFHFLPGEEKIEGRAMELMLILKDKESKAVKQREKIKKEKDELLLENGRLMEENGKLMTENGKLLQENVLLKDERGLMDRKIRVLEKKVKKVEMRCSQAVMSNQVISLVFIIFIAVIVGVFLLKIIRY